MGGLDNLAKNVISRVGIKMSQFKCRDEKIFSCQISVKILGFKKKLFGALKVLNMLVDYIFPFVAS